MTRDEAYAMITDEMVDAALEAFEAADVTPLIPIDERMRAALTAANAAAWRPIESAPRDGTWFVIVNANDDRSWFEVGCYDPYMITDYVETEPGSGLYRAEKLPSYDWRGFSNFHRATHWMPLPAPPANPEASE